MVSPRRRDLLELVALGAMWGASFLFMRIAVPEFGVLPLVSVRVTTGGLFLLPVLLLRGGSFAPLAGRWGHLLVLSLATQVVPFALFTYASAHLPAGTSAILNATVPFFGALIGALGFGVRLQPTTLAGVGCGFLGVVLLIWSRGNAVNTGGSLLAVLACLLASSCYGFAANFARHHFAGVDPVTTTAGSQGIALSILAPFGLAYAPAANPSLLAWACVLALGVLCTAIAYLIYYRLIRSAGPAFTMSVTYLVPMFGVVWSALFLSEPVTAGMLLAGAVILSGVALTAR